MLPITMCRCGTIHHRRSPALTRRAALRLVGGAALAPMLAGCERIAPLVVSEETVEELGLQTWARLRDRMPLSTDEEARRAVASVAQRLLAAAGQEPSRWEVEIFAQPDVNAFVLPGGKIGVFEGLLQVAQSDGEIAAVIGHEIGHLEAEHSRERLTAEVLRQWGMRLIAFLLDVNEVAFAREIAALLGVGVEFGLVRPYSRGQELEADRLGLFTMTKANFDPREAVALWQRMDQLPTGRTPALLSTHPAPQARIQEIEAIIPEAIEAARA